MGLPLDKTRGLPHWTDDLKYNQYQMILGMVHVTACVHKKNAPWSSVWHNNGDIGWYISRFWTLRHPITLDPIDCSSGGFQTSVRLNSRPGYREKLIAAYEKEQVEARDVAEYTPW